MNIARLALAARIVLGVFYLLSGLNWFVGFTPMLPHVGMPTDLPIKHAVVSEMIGTGWMFQSAKVVEILFGLSMLFNRGVPVMLLVALPVAFLTFMLDAIIFDDIARWFLGGETLAELGSAIFDMIVGGLCVLLIHLWLIWSYADYYRPMLVWKAAPGMPATRATGYGRVWHNAFFIFGWFALSLQLWNLFLFIGMIGG